MAADELHRAWAKLDQLEAQERYLVERLSQIHKEIKAQKLEIDDLVKGRPSAINRLPTELLSQIFTLCIPDGKFPEKPLRRIVCVSRHWKDVVWNNPVFWTSIKVTPTLGEKFLKKQLQWSGPALLDIWIEDWDDRPLYDARGKLHVLLGAIVPHANRWRSLIISDTVDVGFVQSILTKILNHLSVPSLREFSLDIWVRLNCLRYPEFLSPTCAPALQHLTLGSPLQLNNFVAPPTLKTLRLTFPDADGYFRPPPVVSMLAPAQSLISLVLNGDSTGWPLKQNDLHYPLLEELTLRLNRSIPFLEAIVAPKLRYVQCSINDPLAFDTIEGKFRDVYDLSLRFLPRVNNRGAESVCRAFPGVRHVHLSMRDTFAFVTGICGSGVLERRPPIDQWLNLETVTLDGLHRRYLERLELGSDPIAKWLIGRQESGLSRLHVKLSQTQEDESGLSSTYFALLERHCNLEVFTSST